MSFGYSGTLWFKQASTYGEAIDMSTATQYVLPFTSESLTFDIDRVVTEHIRASRFKQDTEDDVGLKKVSGSFTGKVPWGVNFGILLNHLLGKVAGAGTTHTYTFNDKVYPGLSIAVNKGGATYIADGIQIASIDFSFTLGGYVEYTCNVVGSNVRIVSAITAPALTLETTPPYWLPHQVTFKIDAVAENVTGVDLSIANELADADDQSFALGSQTRALLPAIGNTVTGTIRRRHVNDGASSLGSKFWDEFVAGTMAKLEIIVAHPNQGTWSATFTFNDCKFTGNPVNIGDKSHVMEEAPFEAFDVDGTSTSIVIVDDNSAAPSASTGTYDGSGN